MGACKGKYNRGILIALMSILGAFMFIGHARPVLAEEAWDGKEVSIYSGGDGTKESPYEIGCGAELAYLRKMVNGGEPYEDTYFILTADIDLNKKNWTAIGTSMTEFCGYLDGDGYVISNLYIKRKSKGQGLFAYTLDAQISNLTLLGVNIQGKNYVGGIVGIAENTALYNCSVSGMIQGENYVGGFIGAEKQGIEPAEDSGETVTPNPLKLVRGCANKAKVIGSQYVGGIAGSYQGCVYNSNNYGDVYGALGTGGIAGYASAEGCINHGTIGGIQNVGGICGAVLEKLNVVSCVNLGSIQASIEVGGVCGYIPEDTVVQKSSNYGSVTGKERVGGVCGFGSFSECFNMGTVTGSQYIGGISGYIYGGISENGYNRGKVTGGSGSKYIGGIAGYIQAAAEGGSLSFCYSTGKVTGKANVGGIAGYNGGTVSDTFYLVDSSNIGIGGGNKGSARPREAQALKSKKLLAQLNVEEKLWKQSEGSYPKLVRAKAASSSNLSTGKKVNKVGLCTGKPGKKSVKLSWSPLMRVTGYEIERYDSTRKKYVRIKRLSSVTLSNGTEYFLDTCTVGSLKGKTTYKFRIRAYKEISGKKYYGKYTKLSVKTK